MYNYCISPNMIADNTIKYLFKAAKVPFAIFMAERETTQSDEFYHDIGYMCDVILITGTLRMHCLSSLVEVYLYAGIAIA